MTVTATVLFEGKDAENAQTTQYTSTNASTIIDKFTVTNTTAGALTISVNLVPLAGSAADANLIVDAKSVAGGADVDLTSVVGHTLKSGGFISTLASATGLTIRASGRVIT